MPCAGSAQQLWLLTALRQKSPVGEFKINALIVACWATELLTSEGTFVSHTELQELMPVGDR
jgi:hypothetical protein